MEELMSIVIPEHITVKELSEKMMVKPTDVVKDLFMKGKMVTLNSDLKFEEAEELALEYNCIVEREEKENVIANLLMEEEEDEKDQVSRPPVVCVMGHVDHGKTSLLDAIRDTRVTDREAGGITQKIGAYIVNVKDRKITFLDTPGHEAFTAMRMRGAKSTDIAILVVAADDGVMPQTVEAINHAKAAGVEIIVAVNKIDKPNANVERVKQELSEYELIPEDWGGSTIFVPVSAHTHEGIDDLLDMILLTADVLELKANPKRNVRGVVIEAELDKGRGVVATVLVQKGTLHVGDPVACGPCYGKVRAMTDEYGKHLKKAGPSTPVEIQGLSAVPTGGEIFMSFDSEKEAHSFAETFIAEEKKSLIDETRSRMSLDGLFTKIQEGKVKELDIIVKADVQGSVEAVKQSLEKLSNEEVVVKVIHGGVGAINESDVTLAAASNAVIIGFNVRPDAVAKQTADTQGVDIRLYNVIYNAIEDVEDAMKGMLEPVFEEKVTGHAEVRQIFKSSGVGNIAGSIVTDGTLERDSGARIFRGDDMIYEGKLISLKRFKDDVKEVKSGFECGLVFEGFGEFLEGDRIECYKMVEVPRS
jgi:translation initiation factor IF-2